MLCAFGHLEAQSDKEVILFYAVYLPLINEPWKKYGGAEVYHLG